MSGQPLLFSILRDCLEEIDWKIREIIGIEDKLKLLTDFETRFWSVKKEEKIENEVFFFKSGIVHKLRHP